MITVTIDIDHKDGSYSIRQEMFVAEGFDPTTAQIDRVASRALERAQLVLREVENGHG